MPTAAACPNCKATAFTFQKTDGPADAAAKLNEELRQLKASYEQKVTEIQAERPAPDTSSIDERAAVWLSDNPDQSLGEAKKKERVRQLHERYVATHNSILARASSSNAELAVVFCAQCGHVVGTTLSPEKVEGYLRIIESRFSQLETALSQVCSAVASSNESVVAVATSNESVAAILQSLQYKIASLDARAQRGEDAETFQRKMGAVTDALNLLARNRE